MLSLQSKSLFVSLMIHLFLLVWDVLAKYAQLITIVGWEISRKIFQLTTESWSSSQTYLVCHHYLIHITLHLGLIVSYCAICNIHPTNLSESHHKVTWYSGGRCPYTGCALRVDTQMLGIFMTHGFSFNNNSVSKSKDRCVFLRTILSS